MPAEPDLLPGHRPGALRRQLREPLAVGVYPDRLRWQLGVDRQAVANELQARNVVSNAGYVQVGPEYIPIEPTGIFEDVDAIGDLRITSRDGSE